MATVRWNGKNGQSTKLHILNGDTTLCGKEVPFKGKEWSAFGCATCARCLAIQEKNSQEEL